MLYASAPTAPSIPPRDEHELEAFAAGKGYFDVVFEAAGQGSTVVSALRYARPRATLVTVGQGATAELPVSMIVTKELNLRGSFRFDTEFDLAVELIGEKRASTCRRSLATRSRSRRPAAPSRWPGTSRSR